MNESSNGILSILFLKSKEISKFSTLKNRQVNFLSFNILKTSGFLCIL